MLREVYVTLWLLADEPISEKTYVSKNDLVLTFPSVDDILKGDYSGISISRPLIAQTFRFLERKVVSLG